MRIAVGSDDAAFELRDALKAHLKQRGIDFEDLSEGADQEALYPDVANAVAGAVADGRFDRGLCLCGTGLGVSITANKIPGIRAAQAHDAYSGAKARSSNDANVLTMGGRVIGAELAKTVLDAFLDTEFAGGRSAPKVARLNQIDADHRASRA